MAKAFQELMNMSEERREHIATLTQDLHAHPLRGKVYLIGAGPGDEELLTLKAKRALEHCTAAMYDRLANPAILRYLPENCERHYCGKEPGAHSKTQAEINDLLVTLAKTGHVVARIKGGDPYVFGRGGEEALCLQAEGILFEVIPGISSAIAALNYAGIPISHRGLAQSFHVFTGTSAERLDINWQAAAAIDGTLVFLMGLGNIELIVGELTQRGKSPQTPCAVIMKGTTAQQKSVFGTLENICERAAAAHLESPSIIVVGAVTELADRLNWYERKPLFGLNICLTRSKEQAQELRERLLDLGAEVTEIPTIAVVRHDDALRDYLPKLTEYRWIVFTSVNGVNTFFDALKAQEYDIRRIRADFAAIGPATANAIKERGVMPVIIAKEFVAESLLESLKERIQPGEAVFVGRSEQARPYLVEQLRAHGCEVDEVATYRVEQPPISDARLDDANVITFTSPTTVRHLIEMVGVDRIRPKRLLAIGPITLQELQKHGLDAEMCDEYSTDGIIKKLTAM
ncbi:uroporphyrin-III C-methyltransferase [Candidatus Moduliflexus flocculans]|uniref:uroporphyrinogen-III C-methyltransferase n=1 Tax=Candidatus Moduliflexus flocculans TaxID=1499966 RepID=A0A0S6VSR8_9BACT|nr:uroporphyrin-III C-methyltransferase [Candidatus Moduliflexus flocculans]